MATIVRCNCSAEYKRTETKFLVPHTGDAVCTVCGAALESWWTSTHIPSSNLSNVQIEGRQPSRTLLTKVDHAPNQILGVQSAQAKKPPPWPSGDGAGHPGR